MSEVLPGPARYTGLDGRPWYDVRSYGALGNDSTDDYAAFAAAIADSDDLGFQREMVDSLTAATEGKTSMKPPAGWTAAYAKSHPGSPLAAEAQAALFDTDAVFRAVQDEKDAAEIRAMNSQALRQLADAGCDWDKAVAYMASGEVTDLKGAHSGLFSVQLQPPGSKTPQNGQMMPPPNGTKEGASA